MDLGRFSVSLAVRDIKASRAFYEAFGFTRLDGDVDQGWLMLENGQTKIGLFQGMFPDDLLTFNPPDARAVQAALMDRGVAVEKPVADGEGPCSFMVRDPDGRTVLIDQH
jgi:catechol 2,3-dioxygenase-like lactoylglutathione lyase family enzyme